MIYRGPDPPDPLRRFAPKLRFSLYQFEDLEAHSGVVVGALPEAGLGGVLVGSAVGVDGPEPFAVVEIHEVVADVGPGGKGAERKVLSSVQSKKLLK